MKNATVGNSCAVNGLENTSARTQCAPEPFRSLVWSRNDQGAWVSFCGTYEIAARYTNGHFAWRGRDVHTDKLICSSIDPEFVKRTCESHAASVAAEAS